VGYDPWAQRLLSASPASGRIVLDVGHLLGLRQGENPHRWYDPADVKRVAQAITADLQRLHPQARNGYRRRYDSFLRTGLAPYDRLIAAIRDRYAGVAIGASESIFAPLSAALGLRLITPASFMNAISEGSEVSAQDVLRTQRQITSRQIKVWIYNAQNATPAIQHLNSLARAQHIPIVTITETLSPATASFEQWQVTQLERLRRALRDATGR
jgi:zinc/manganese transport system substrate-binding protein